MHLPALLAGVAVPPVVGAALKTLLARKAAAGEADTVPREPALERLLGDVLAERAPRPGRVTRQAVPHTACVR